MLLKVAFTINAVAFGAAGREISKEEGGFSL